MSGTMDKIKAKVDNVLHKDSGGDATGPHQTHSANKADPRVDSDHIGGTGNTASAGGYNTTGTTGHTGMTGTTGHTGMTGSSTTGNYGTYGSDTTGPHDSRMANKLDPRVDSDRIGGTGNTASAGGYNTTGGMSGGMTGTTGTTGHTGMHGTTGTTGTYGTTGSDPTGPHNSRMANKVDPRVDSDRVGGMGNTQGAGGMGGGQYTEGMATGTGTTGAHHGHQGHHGHHGHHATPGTGNAQNTAGPHNSDLLNKADPRVDSDLDGSKTMGGNQTYQ